MSIRTSLWRSRRESGARSFQAASILSGALGRTITAEIITPENMLQAVSDGLVTPPAFMEGHYALSTLEWLQQTYDGRMDYSAVTTTTVEELLGRAPIHLAEWAVRHRDALLAAETVTPQPAAK